MSLSGKWSARWCVAVLFGLGVGQSVLAQGGRLRGGGKERAGD